VARQRGFFSTRHRFSISFTYEAAMTYHAPVRDMLFDIEHIAQIDTIAALPGFEEAGLDTAQAVLEESARFNEGVLAPLNVMGDRQPSSWKACVVTTTPGFVDAFRQYAEGGWQGLQHPTEFGGQGLPKIIGAACGEMLNAANMSFALCPLLSDGAIEALLTAGSDALKATYLEKLVSGAWTGTMNLTEPQAGSDLALVRTRADRQPGAGTAGEDTYRVFGTKIYITYGEHDMAENIVHLVLARVAGAPEGVKGISLFVVPKFIPDASGAPGARNDVQCVSIEHKLGIKASPTAVLQFGDGIGDASLGGAGAVGWLVGEENRGLEYMFIMMNAARYAVGMQGIAIADRAYQKAVGYARDRVQSRPVDGSAKQSVAIIEHPDVRRMLMTMRGFTEGCRAMASFAAAAYDRAHHAPDEADRLSEEAVYEFLVPLVKGFSTEMSIEVTSLGIQVHGGMGFIEETGAAQYYRDARILTIYEGTTAIQANDLVGRKTLRDGGRTARALIAEIETTEGALAASGTPDARAVCERLVAARIAFGEAVGFILANGKSNPNAVYAGSVPYLMLAGNLMAGWQMARSLLAAQECLARDQDAAFMRAKIATARFYAEHILVRTSGLRDSILGGAESVMAVALEAF
jgi:alkylation response protein AidB-like acyl-CoA dehydrogenase